MNPADLPGTAVAGQDPGRRLASYLLAPRPEAGIKALIAPAYFALAGASTGQFGGWPRFAALWLVLEGLIYPARYQWNDIRGADGDRRHAEARARGRLPRGLTAADTHRNLQLSRAAATARLLAALLIGILAGLLGQVLLLGGLVLAAAAGYEFLRAPPAAPSRAPQRGRVVAIWLVVGLGYLVRGGLGLRLAGLAWGSPALIAGLASATSFGIMFVLLTWVLEATSFCVADPGGWDAGPGLGRKPHLAALLPYLGRPIRTGPSPAEPGRDSGTGPGRYGGTEPVLRGGSPLAAPWNLALLAAGTSGAVEGVALARPAAGGAGVYLAAAAVGLTGAVLLARCRGVTSRWIRTAGWAPALFGVTLLGHPALPVLACVPWLAVAAVYSIFCGLSYRDLVTPPPALAALSRLRRSRTPRQPR